MKKKNETKVETQIDSELIVFQVQSSELDIKNIWKKK